MFVLCYSERCDLRTDNQFIKMQASEGKPFPTQVYNMDLLIHNLHWTHMSQLSTYFKSFFYFLFLIKCFFSPNNTKMVDLLYVYTFSGVYFLKCNAKLLSI